MTQPHILIGFSTPKNDFAIAAAMIRFVENTPYSHVYVKIWSDIIDGYIVYQETFSGLGAMNGEIFDQHVKIFSEYKINVTEEQLTKIMHFFQDNYGLPYGVRQIAGMLTARVLRQLGFHDAKNPFADGIRTMVCSEMVGAVLLILGETINKSELEIEGPKMIHRAVVKLFGSQRSSNV